MVCFTVTSFLRVHRMNEILGMIIVAFIGAAIVANRYMPPNTRTILMVMTNIPTVVGFAMVAWCKSSGGRLAGYWLTGASNATFVVGLSLVSGNVGGQTKKALASAAIFLGVAAGNIVGPFLFKDSEAPVYLTGIIGCLVSRALEIVIIIILRIIFVTSNKRRDRAVAEGRMEYDERVSALEDISDWRNPAFRYVAVSPSYSSHRLQWYTLPPSTHCLLPCP